MGRCDVHFHLVYPALQTAFQITTVFFSSGVSEYNIVLNFAPQVFSLLVSGAVIQP